MGDSTIRCISFRNYIFNNISNWIIKAIPTNLKFAVSAGIGLFIAFIGLKNAGIVVANSATFVGLGDLTDPTVLLSIFGVIAISIFMVRGSKIAIF